MFQCWGDEMMFFCGYLGVFGLWAVRHDLLYGVRYALVAYHPFMFIISIVLSILSKQYVCTSVLLLIHSFSSIFFPISENYKVP